MPRTKTLRRVKQERQSLEESDVLAKDFQRKAQMRIMKMEAEAKMSIKSLETFIDVALSRLPKSIQRMTLGELCYDEDDENDEKENCNKVTSSVTQHELPAPPTAKVKKGTKRTTAVSDDGYVTEDVATSRASRAKKQIAEVGTTRRTRSTSRNSRMKLSEVNQATVKKRAKFERGKESVKVDKFKTPALMRVPQNEFALVTPKVKPNTPMSVLRHPRQGEMVLSMQGSPLLVSATVHGDTANIHVPLRDGNVISLLPNDGLRMSHIPSLDPETMRQLETLKSHIEKVISIK